MAEFSEKKAREQVHKGAKNINTEDMENVLGKKEKLKKKFLNSSALKGFFEDVKMLMALISNFVNGRYREIPYWSIAAITAALLYVLNPVDLIPDFIPGIGLVDDAAVVAACLAMVEKDFNKYKEWKVQHA
ncbi:MAG: DUF1232 domain-containing protein [Desulfobacteraceae bacterium]|nr:DUF1232 domain-containing protein [Desulfobacteraceae bacterium]